MVDQRQRGAALVAVLLATAILLLLGTGLAALANDDLRITRLSYERALAFNIAEGGIDYARTYLTENPAWRQTGPFALGAGSFTLAYTDLGGGRLRVTSTGQAGRAQQRVTAEFRFGNPLAGTSAFRALGDVNIARKVEVVGEMLVGGTLALTKSSDLEVEGDLRVGGDIIGLVERDKDAPVVEVKGDLYHSGLVGRVRLEVDGNTYPDPPVLPEYDPAETAAYLEHEARSWNQYYQGNQEILLTDAAYPDGSVIFVAGSATVRGEWNGGWLTIFATDTLTVNGKVECSDSARLVLIAQTSLRVDLKSNNDVDAYLWSFGSLWISKQTKEVKGGVLAESMDNEPGNKPLSIVFDPRFADGLPGLPGSLVTENWYEGGGN
ncbi:MAG: hypothetical protein AB1331_03300 [Bacillota bacterium]